LKRAGKYEQAIKEFQQARNDTKRCAAANLETGECFQQIKQFKLAINSYEEALEACGPSDREVQKLALYRAGWLCKGLKDYVNAEKFLSQLASIDFGYKDTSQMLDEVSKKNKES
jgi:tetratricopeptide (TPR) repeat protein